MRILLSFENFDDFGGTETYTLTVAQQLAALGHDVAIYSPNRGAIAQFARQEGVRVLGTRELPQACDLVLFEDAATCHELAPRYGDAVRLFVAHSRDHALQSPPLLTGRCDAVIVLNDRVRRAVEARSSHAPVVRLRQPIDTSRFRNLGAPRSPARHALVLTNYVGGPRAAVIERACRANGIELSWVGATTSASATPEHAIANADIVIGLGRSVLEGMAAGRAVYVYGIVGGDGWVTPKRYPAMEADGFAGLSAKELTMDPARLTDDLGRWNQTMGEVNRDLVFAHHEAREHAIELVCLARRFDGPRSAETKAGDELALLIRREREAYTRAVAAFAEANRLRSLLGAREQQTAALDAQLADAGAYIAKLENRLDALRRTRRYRLAGLVALPLDHTRRRRDAKRS
jgi:hypothetical protein